MDRFSSVKLILAVLAMMHYCVTVAIACQLGQFIGYALIIICCIMLSISIFSVLDTLTSKLGLILMVLIPISTLSVKIHPKDLQRVYLFQLLIILFNCIYHLFLYKNISYQLTVPCIVSFIDGITFIIAVIFLRYYQSNKLLSFNIALEILLLAFMTLNMFNVIFFIYMILNLPFYKSYLIWKYMYQPAKYKDYQYVIVRSKNNTTELLHRMYSEIHILLHSKTFKYIPNETSKLLNENQNQYTTHRDHSMKCWQLQYQFMRKSIVEQKEFIQQFVNCKYNCYMHILFNLYAAFSVIFHLLPYPLIFYCHAWSSHYDATINCFIIIMYTIFLVVSILYTVRYTFDVYWTMKYQWELRQIHDSKTSVSKMIHCKSHLKQMESIAPYFTPDIGLLIIKYCYGMSNRISKCKKLQRSKSCHRYCHFIRIDRNTKPQSLSQ
eukprot:405192_1